MKRIEQVTCWRINGILYESKDVAIAAAGYHKCPKCNGGGLIFEEYNAYPSGLPDSGFVEDIRIKSIECDICNGLGYTEKEFKPVTQTQVVGYRSV